MAKSETPSNKTAAAYRQPCLRADLRLVYDNPVTGKGQVRIVDPRNSRQFAFTEREHALCQAADGSADLATIHAALTAELEGGISLAEVTEFFRRLHILGLLAPEGTRIDPATAPKTGPRAGARAGARSGARLGPRAELGAAAGARRQSDRQSGLQTGLQTDPADPSAAAGTASGPAPATGPAAAPVPGPSASGPSVSGPAGLRPGAAPGPGRRAATAAAGAGRAALSADTEARLAQLRRKRGAEADAAPQPPTPDLPPGAGDVDFTTDFGADASAYFGTGPTAPASAPPAGDAAANAATGEASSRIATPAADPAAPPPDARPDAQPTTQSDAKPEAPARPLRGSERAAARRRAEAEAAARAKDAAAAAAANPVSEVSADPAAPPAASQDGSQDTPQDGPQDTPQDTPQDGLQDWLPNPEVAAAPRRRASVLQLRDRRPKSAEAGAAPGPDRPDRPEGRQAANDHPGDPDQDPQATSPTEGGAAAHKPAFDFFDPDFDDPEAGGLGAGLGGGMGGGMGGGPGGGMGGGMMPGGFGGGMMGGMAGGMGGGGAGMRGRGGMMGGMMGGGMGAMGGGMGAMGGAGGGMAGGGMMPGGMGGMGGGMGGGAMRGAMMGGMMGGGGMGGGGMGGGGMMGAMGGGMMGGGMPGMMGGGMAGMGGMRGRAPEAQSEGEKGPAQLKLFNPNLLLRALYILGYPLKYVLWMIVPLLVIAGMTMIKNFAEMGADLAALFDSVGTIGQFMIGLFIANLFSRLAQGVAIVAYGARVPAFGVTLIFGVVPRFYIDKSAIAQLDRRGQLWAHGAPLLARLMTFALGVLVWAITRDQGGMLPQIALVAGQFGLLVFIATAWPFMLSDGMRWLSTLFNEPKLVPKAAMAFKHMFLKGQLPPMLEKRDVMPLTLYAVGVLLTMSLFLAVLGLGTLLWLEAEFDGLGVIIFLGLMGAFTLWLMALLASVKARGPAGRGGKGGMGGAQAFDREGFRQMLQGKTATADMPLTAGMASVAGMPGAATDPEAEAQRSLPGRAKVVWVLIGLGLLVFAFQPYSYEAGGQVEFLPAARGQAVARTDGEIIEVLVREGDVVTRGQVLAQLSSWDQERTVGVTETQLLAAEGQLAKLLAGPKPEEIELALRQVESAEASVAFSQAEADRAQVLAESGAGSQTAYEQALSTLQTDLANLEVSRASLDLVMSGATETDIAIAQAEVDRLTLELEFARSELERTQIVASMDGRIVTANLQLLTGSYMRAGDPLLEVENAEVISAVIAVPESDIALIAPGDVVRLKAWGQSDIEIDGEVQSIAPAADDEGYGSVVRVTAVFPNPDDFLRSGMTGYAKVDGAEMRAWEAYLRSIMRFFQIEVWSWIP